MPVYLDNRGAHTKKQWLLVAVAVIVGVIIAIVKGQ
jgi:hypothetical protein